MWILFNFHIFLPYQEMYVLQQFDSIVLGFTRVPVNLCFNRVFFIGQPGQSWAPM